MGLLKRIFILVLFLLPLGEIVRIDLGNTVILKPLDIGVGLLIILWLALKLREREAIKQKYILTPILFFAAIGSLSLFINSSYLSFDQFFASIMYLLRWIVYAGTFFVVCDFDQDFKKRIFKLLLIVGSLIVGLGYLQYFFYSNAKPLLYLGWDEHMYRMFVTFLDPNFAGAFFVLFFLFIVNLFLKKKNTKVGFLLVLTLGAIFLTFSRSAMIMLLASSIVFLIMIGKKRWIVAFIIALVIMFSISFNYFYIENINFFRTVSTRARLETTSNALKIIKDYPILGVGFNAHRYSQLRYGLRNDNAAIKSHADAGVDNSFLFVLATTGVVGFIAYLFLWYRILNRHWFNSLVISSILGLFINSLFLNSLFYPPIILWMWVMLGVTEKN